MKASRGWRAFFLASVLVCSAACAPGVETPETAGINRLVVIAVDGATWDVIDPMMARGELPNFRGLVDRGARSDMIAVPPLASPVVWTTYATGAFPREHNILDFTYPYVDGDKHPIESTARRRPALWNVASRHGRSVGVVGYYVTNPAEVVDGFVVSDTTLEQRPASNHPADIADGLEMVPERDRPALFGPFLPWAFDRRDADDPDSPYYQVTRVARNRVDGALIRDENTRRAALQLLPRAPDIFLAYFRIVDHTSHATWLYFDDSDFDDEPDPADKELLENVIPEAYRYVDDLLGAVVRQIGDGTNIIVLSDHGFGSATGPYSVPDPKMATVISGNHRYNGMLLAAGPDIRHGEFQGLTGMDVVPLLAALSGLPISRQLQGVVPEWLLTDEFVERSPPEMTDSYVNEWSFAGDAVADIEADEAALDQLKALGYIGAETAVGRTDTRDVGFWSIDRDLRASALQGELIFYLMRRKEAELDRTMAEVVELDPILAEYLPRVVGIELGHMQESFSFPLADQAVVDRFLDTYDTGGARGSSRSNRER